MKTKRHRSYTRTCLDERLNFVWLWMRGLSLRFIGRLVNRSPDTVRRWVYRALRSTERHALDTRCHVGHWSCRKECMCPCSWKLSSNDLNQLITFKFREVETLETIKEDDYFKHQDGPNYITLSHHTWNAFMSLWSEISGVQRYLESPTAQQDVRLNFAPHYVHSTTAGTAGCSAGSGDTHSLSLS